MDVCERHADKPIASWCMKHETPLCIECLLQDHRGCINDVEEIKVVKETVEAEARTLVQKYSTLSEGLDLWTLHGKKTLKSLIQTKSSMARGITLTRQRLIERVNALAADSLVMIDSVFEEQERILKNDMKELESLNNRMVSIHGLLQDFFSDTSNMMSSPVTLKTRDEVLAAKASIKHVEESLQNNRLLKRNINVVFYLSKEVEELPKTLTTFGELCVEDLNARANKPSKKPSSLHIGKILADDNNIDESVFAQHTKPQSLDSSLYCKIDHLQPSDIAPPSLASGMNLKKVSTLPLPSRRIIYKKQPNNARPVSAADSDAIETLNADNVDKPYVYSCNKSKDINRTSSHNTDSRFGMNEGTEANGSRREDFSDFQTFCLSYENAEHRTQRDSGFLSLPPSGSSEDLHVQNNRRQKSDTEFHIWRERSRSALDLSGCRNNDKDTDLDPTLPKRHTYVPVTEQRSEQRSEHSAKQTSRQSLGIFNRSGEKVSKFYNPEPELNKPQGLTHDSKPSGFKTVDMLPTPVAHRIESPKLIRRKHARSRSSTSDKSAVLITGLCVVDVNTLFLCKSNDNVVQLANILGDVVDEYMIGEPFGCCTVGENLVAVTSQARRTVAVFRVEAKGLRLCKEEELNVCSDGNMFSISHSTPYLAIACLNRIVVLNQNDFGVYNVVQPMMPGSNKKWFYQNVMFAELFLSDCSLDVFASDNKREVVSCTDVRNEIVKWTVNMNSPNGLFVASGKLFVASKFRVSVLRPENGRVLMEFRAQVPKKPWAITVRNNTIYVSRKSKNSEESCSLRTIPFQPL